MRTAVLVLALGMSGCYVNCTDMPPTTVDYHASTIAMEWVRGQDALIAAGYPESRVMAVRPEAFKFTDMQGSFMCGNVMARGCFYPDEWRIAWDVNTPGVLRHEAGHAILYAIRSPDWRDWEGG